MRGSVTRASSAEQEPVTDRRLTTRELTVFAMLGAVMYASKMLMEVLPNVHLLGTFIVAFTVVYRKRHCIQSIFM